jgi:hypothetical protein
MQNKSHCGGDKERFHFASEVYVITTAFPSIRYFFTTR